MNFHVADLDDIEALLREYDDNLVHRATTDNMLGLVDASSLLWRLEVMARITRLIYLSRLVWACCERIDTLITKRCKYYIP